MKIKKAAAKTTSHSRVVFCKPRDIKKLEGLTKEEKDFLVTESESGKDWIAIHQLNRLSSFCILKDAASPELLEKVRGYGNSAQAEINKMAQNDFLCVNMGVGKEIILSFVEGMALGSYQFLKYRKDREERKNALSTLHVLDPLLKESDLEEVQNLVRATCLARDLVNEPVSYLTAATFSKEMQKAGKAHGFSVKVLHKKEIEDHKMGGLLAVNAGSIDPPTFNIMEYKSPKAKNKTPIVLVGKGVVFDTGGLSLKPTPGSMDEMKCDMAGAAAVVGAMSAIAANKLPLYVIALVPSTDNRPGMNAVCPQDVITISDGTTVEVMNTDAEGRLILADALVYAKKYKPQLVMDFATLTGAAVRAVGTYASAVMGTANDREFAKLDKSGMQVWERNMRFPLWKDYGDEMKSDVADLKNLGGANAGHISAGKFLEHFTDYPWIHVDIAGPAWSNTASSYRPKGGTGVGVRLIYDFLKKGI
ncbi:MAG: peptidase M17 [Flavobacteriales bacterium]|nr:peptidase M17 [Flavobacteriales bacterium]